MSLFPLRFALSCGKRSFNTYREPYGLGVYCNPTLERWLAWDFIVTEYGFVWYYLNS